jgi:hypothetical protein
MRSVCPTAISTEPLCTQLIGQTTISSALLAERHFGFELVRQGAVTSISGSAY